MEEMKSVVRLHVFSRHLLFVLEIRILFCIFYRSSFILGGGGGGRGERIAKSNFFRSVVNVHYWFFVASPLY